MSSYILTRSVTDEDAVCVVADWYGEHAFEVVALAYWRVAAAEGEVEPALRTDGVVVELGCLIGLDGRIHGVLCFLGFSAA